jgi:hypothetical protein
MLWVASTHRTAGRRRRPKEDTGGEAQSIKQSFEADRLEQLPIIFFFLPPYCFYLDSPPPCVFFSPPACGMSLLGDREDVNCVTDSCASPLHNHEFLSLQLRPNIVWNGSRPLLSQGFCAATAHLSHPGANTFCFSRLSASLHVEYARYPPGATGQAIPPSSGTNATGPKDSLSMRCSLRVKRINCCSPSGPTGTSRRPPTFNC